MNESPDGFKQISHQIQHLYNWFIKKRIISYKSFVHKLDYTGLFVVWTQWGQLKRKTYISFEFLDYLGVSLFFSCRLGKINFNQFSTFLLLNFPFSISVSYAPYSLPSNLYVVLSLSVHLYCTFTIHLFFFLYIFSFLLISHANWCLGRLSPPSHLRCAPLPWPWASVITLVLKCAEKGRKTDRGKKKKKTTGRPLLHPILGA